jgi:uncharacterized LabA/DUF88 family protein
MSAIKHINQRVAVFIDTQNLYHTAKHVYKNARVNFGHIVEDAVAGRSLVRALAYVITTESGDEKNFFLALEKMGIEIKTKDLQSFVDGTKKADWDVAIAVDAIRIATRVDAVVIVSGDGDFCPLAEYLKQMGVQVEVVCFGQSVSAKLLEEADIFTDLSKDTEYFLIQPGGANGGAIRNKNFTSNNLSSRNVVSDNRDENKGERKSFKPRSNFDKNKVRYPKNPEALKEHLEAAQEESIPLSDTSFTIVRKK